jgi:hypothetical protein
MIYFQPPYAKSLEKYNFVNVNAKSTIFKHMFHKICVFAFYVVFSSEEQGNTSGMWLHLATPIMFKRLHLGYIRRVGLDHNQSSPNQT